VVGVARDIKKAQEATEVVRADAARGGRLELAAADLASLKSVRACADTIVKAGKPFDIVIANAGVMACPQGQTADGFETQFGTNHLGHFVLVNKIAPLIKSGGRIVILSSSGHRLADIDLDDPNFERTPYVPFVAYGRSKTANILYAVELDRRHKPRGIRATAVHPGVIQTELSRHLPAEQWQQLIDTRRAKEKAEGSTEVKSVPQGAATSVWAGVYAPAEDIGGRYCEDCHVASIADDPKATTGIRRYAIDPDRAKALWTKSEAMVGERF
jgi:NAD(P)-dependent dehydrogenase (short-subunit alcohol dehydrogenase family)